MKKALIYLFFTLFIGVNFAQIPNPDFEQWKQFNIDKPTGWTTFGITQKVAGYKSPFAVRISRNKKQGDAPGAVVYGQPEGGFNGGIPYKARPDSLVGFFKTHVLPGDSAWFVALLKRGGKTISMNIFILTGTDTVKFNRKSFALVYSDTGMSDSVIVGVASTNPEDTFMNSFVVADSLHFVGGGTNAALPNANFEQWQVQSFDDPVGWFSTNSMIPLGVSPTVTKSTDRVFGSYSARIQNIKMPNGQIVPGYLMAGVQTNDGPGPGFPVFGKDSVLYFNYKCSPKGSDTMMIGIMMFDSGQMVGMGVFSTGTQTTSWTQASVKIGYFPLFSGVPDSAAVFCAAFLGGKDPTDESVLYVDGLKLNNPMTKVQTTNLANAQLQLFPNPAKTDISVLYEVNEPGNVFVGLFDGNGKLVVSIFNGVLNSGLYAGKCDISYLSNGIYYCRVISDSGLSSQPVQVLR